MHEKINNLKNNKDKDNKEDLDQVIKDLAIQAMTNYKKVKEELNMVKTNKGGILSKYGVCKNQCVLKAKILQQPCLKEKEIF